MSYFRIKTDNIDRDEMKRFLNANGWSERLVENNWIKDADADAGRVNIEYGGLRMEEAYKRCRNEIIGKYLINLVSRDFTSFSISPDGNFCIKWEHPGAELKGVLEGYFFDFCFSSEDLLGQYNIGIKAIKGFPTDIEDIQQFINLLISSLKYSLKREIS